MEKNCFLVNFGSNFALVEARGALVDARGAFRGGFEAILHRFRVNFEVILGGFCDDLELI